MTTVRVGGALCLAGGSVGAAGTAYLAATTPTDGTAFSFPHPINGATALQMALALVPAVLIAGLVALRSSGAVPSAGRARLGYYGAIAVLAGLASLGGIAVTVTESSPDVGAPAFGVLYAGYLMLLAGCLFLAGGQVAWHGRWVGWQRWLPLALGAWVIIPVLPALAVGFTAGAWAIAGWFGLFAVLGLVLVRESPPEFVEGPDAQPRGATSAGAAAVVTWIYVAAWGNPAIPITAYLLRNETLPAFLDLFPMYGGPLWGRLSLGLFVAALIAFFLVTMLAAWAGWLLWNGLRAGAVLTVVLLPIEAAFWIGFSLPLPWFFGAVRLALVLLAWRSLRWSTAVHHERKSHDATSSYVVGRRHR
jgi:hypothetical protein